MEPEPVICAVGDLSSEHCSLNHNGQYNIDTGSDIIGRFIQRPYDEIDTIFSKLMEEDGINPGDFRSLSPSILTKVDVGSFYRKQLSTTNLVERHVPALSKSSIPDTVVRYRGMVQNIYDQEFYCGAYEEINLLHQTSQIKLGKYRDNISIQGYSTDNEIHVNIDGPSGLTLERTSLLLVPVPGESNWSRDIQSLSSDSSRDVRTNNSRKRNVDDITSSDSSILCESDHLSEGYDATAGNHKRGTFEENWNCDRELTRTTTTVSTTSSSLSAMPLAATENDRFPCITRIYDRFDHEDSVGFRLNDLFEIIGIYSVDPVVASDSAEDLLYEADWLDAYMPPSTIAPRIQCLTYRRLGSSFPLLVHINEIALISEGRHLMNVSSLDASTATLRIPSHAAKEYKSFILTSIICALGGADDLTAEYIFLALLSRVYARHESLALGSLSLNLCQCEQNPADVSIANSLSEVIASILPRSRQLSVTIDSLNQSVWLPTRSNDASILQPSPLQLVPGTAVIVDEVRLTEGTLNQQGMRSIRALRSIVASQMLPVDYGCYELPIETDLPCIFLSEGRSSSMFCSATDSLKLPILYNNGVHSTAVIPETIEPMDHCANVNENDGSDNADDDDISIEIIPDEEVERTLKNTNVVDAVDRLSEITIDGARKWFAAVRMLDVAMTNEVATYIEEDFVAIRQASLLLGDDQKPSPSDFHRWLTIARLLAASEDQPFISIDHWTKVKELENARLLRLSSMSMDRNGRVVLPHASVDSRVGSPKSVARNNILL